MNANKIIWIAGPALFSLIGILASYLSNDPRSVTTGAIVGAIGGFALTAFALAGERS